jgi:uncharacterized protein YijF (DUF1287 family)
LPNFLTTPKRKDLNMDLRRNNTLNEYWKRKGNKLVMRTRHLSKTNRAPIERWRLIHPSGFSQILSTSRIRKEWHWWLLAQQKLWNHTPIH